jgi:hypothetical protein
MTSAWERALALGAVEFAVPIVTSVQVDTGTARIGPVVAGHEALKVALRSLDSLAPEPASTGSIWSRSMSNATSSKCLTATACLVRFRPVLVLETGHEAVGDRQAIHDLLDSLGHRMLGLLLDFGMAEAGWPAYVAVDRPFRPGDAHNFLLIPK